MCGIIFALGKARKWAVAAHPALAAILLAVQFALLGAVLVIAALVASMGAKLLKDWGQQKEGLVTILGGALVGILGVVAIVMGNKGVGKAAENAAIESAKAQGITSQAGLDAAQAFGKVGTAYSPGVNAAAAGGGVVATILGAFGIGGTDGITELVSPDSQVQNPDNYDVKDAGNMNTFLQG